MSNNSESAYLQGQADASQGKGPAPTHNVPATVADRYNAGYNGK